MYFSFEIDDECQQVIAERFPEVIQLGDITLMSADKFLELIKGTVLVEMSKETHVIRVCAGPPCWDHTRVKGQAAQGRFGLEGHSSMPNSSLLMPQPWLAL